MRRNNDNRNRRYSQYNPDDARTCDALVRLVDSLSSSRRLEQREYELGPMRVSQACAYLRLFYAGVTPLLAHEPTFVRRAVDMTARRYGNKQEYMVIVWT